MSNSQIDAWLETVPTTQRPTLGKLRQLILAIVPDVIEEIKWSRPCFAGPNGLFCYLQTAKNHATLGFHKGTSLEDPAGLLEGTGKDMRHIKFKTGQSIDESAVGALLKQAVATVT